MITCSRAILSQIAVILTLISMVSVCVCCHLILKPEINPSFFVFCYKVYFYVFFLRKSLECWTNCATKVRVVASRHLLFFPDVTIGIIRNQNDYSRIFKFYCSVNRNTFHTPLELPIFSFMWIFIFAWVFLPPIFRVNQIKLLGSNTFNSQKYITYES